MSKRAGSEQGRLVTSEAEAYTNKLRDGQLKP